MPGCGQKVTCAGVTVAFLVSLLGASAPYWRTGQLSTNSSGFHGGSLSLVEPQLSYRGGLFYFCVDIPDGGTECDLFDFSTGAGAEFSILWLTVVQMALALVCLMTSFCCLTREGKTFFRCQGILSGLVGLCGIVNTVMYLLSPGDSWHLILTSLQVDWALVTYAAGAAAFAFVSLGLCLASPDGICPCLIIRRRGYQDMGKHMQKLDSEK